MLNYYEMLGLPCDGRAVDEVKRIESALKQWELSKTEALNNESQGAKRTALQDELNELPNMRKLLTDAALRRRHADDLKAARLSQVDSIVNIMSKSRTDSKNVAKARLNKIAALLGLLPATIAKRFKDAGYTVVESRPANTNDFIMEDSVLNTINGTLELIRNHMKSNPHEPMQDIVKAENLYEYIAIMDGKSKDDAKDYEHMTTDKLAALFDTNMREHTSNTAPLMWYKSIEADAKNRVMKDDKQREKYNNALKLQQLRSLLELLASVPVSVKLERTFADECIREIQRVFPDEEQAIAIYNKFGEMPMESLYEKENINVATMCECHILNYHDTRKQAESAACVSCGQPLYDTCPKCNQKVPAISEFCACGFFMKGRQSFALHELRFNSAIRASDLPTAQDEYHQAAICDPNNANLPTMDATLKKLVEVLGEPIKKIKSDLDAGKVCAAQQKINALKAARPNVNVQQYQTQIENELSWANGEDEKLRRTSDQGVCVELAWGIVQRVKDYAPALEWLRLHKPTPVLKVSKTTDSVALYCVLQWEDDPRNRYVSYTVIRKEGAKPQNIQDGVQIATDLKSMQYRDTNLLPGKVYVYAVFAVRQGAVSSPTYSDPIFLRQNIRDVQVYINPGACTLSWQDVAGSLGVQVKRSEDGGKSYTVVCSGARSSFTDRSVASNKQYRYSLTTVWEVLGKKWPSPDELIRDVRVEQKPARVDIQLVRVGSDGNCQVQWNATGAGVLYLTAIKSGITVVPDQVYRREMLSTMGDGEPIASAIDVAAGHYAWYAKLERQYQVVAFRSFGDDYVAGQAIRVSTVPAPKIDTKKTTLSNNTLNLYLTGIPQQVRKVYYMVSADGSICTEQMAMQNNLPAVDIAAIQRDGFITIESLPQGMLTLSLLAMYGNGTNVFYSPAAKWEISNQPKKEIKYWIEWQTRGFPQRRKVRSNAKLHVRLQGNRIPELSLCCRKDGKMIFNYTPGSAEIVQLLKINATSMRNGQEVAVFDIPENNMKDLPAGSVIQLFLGGNEHNDYASPLLTDASSQKMPEE